ncbi:hypothetical protein BDZ94DRAFT_293818 [Collybia nuda]|uniref:Uncharacterized protein n=1 Tax=Collybia nuda TaxID=64659 RepID=A0A9P5XUR2_9AGAR|nr:hypothetical protein BDZ94DRAFT_293818 [Collybia nuda]
MASYRSGATPIPADIITYRLGDKLVYVRPADDYEQALDFAQKEFHEELSTISRERISFNVYATMNGERRSVRISESAWAPAVARLLRGEVIDISIRPLPQPSGTKDQPPQYLDVLPQTRLSEPRLTPTYPVRCKEPLPGRRSDKGSSRHWFAGKS